MRRNTTYVRPLIWYGILYTRYLLAAYIHVCISITSWSLSYHVVLSCMWRSRTATACSCRVGTGLWRAPPGWGRRQSLIPLPDPCCCRRNSKWDSLKDETNTHNVNNMPLLQCNAIKVYCVWFLETNTCTTVTVPNETELNRRRRLCFCEVTRFPTNSTHELPVKLQISAACTHRQKHSSLQLNSSS